MTFRVLILGGYGQFGRRISRRLADEPGLSLLIAGRNGASAVTFVAALGPTAASVSALTVDVDDPQLTDRLRALRPDLIIHTGGPFQGQDYRVAEAAIAIGSHYVDLADGRDFVAGIGALDAAARASGCLVVSGASTVPALSAAAIDRLRIGLARIDTIDIGISPGNRTDRGLATVAAILGHVGRPLAVWRDHRWTRAHGWQRLRRHRYPAPMGRRWLAACDVPDLALFPPRYRAATVEFRAGLELPVLHLGLWSLSWLRRARIVADWSRHASVFLRMSRWFQRRGSDVGGMHVTITGCDDHGRACRRTWSLVASHGDGPEIPATAAVLLAQRLAAGTLRETGARPCLDLITLDEFDASLARYAVTTCVEAQLS